MKRPQALCAICAAWSTAQQSRLCIGHRVLSRCLQVVGVVLMAILITLNVLDTLGG